MMMDTFLPHNFHFFRFLDNNWLSFFVMLSNCLSFLRKFTAKTQSLELHLAASMGNVALLEQLIDEDEFDINYAVGLFGTALFQATIQDRVECFIYLVQHGASLDGDHPRDNKDATILHVAAKYGSLGIVKYLLEDCCMKVNNDFPTPMDVACNFGEFEILQYLVEKQGYHQSFTLHYAAYKGHLDMVDYCIAQGADIEGRGGGGSLHPIRRPALHFAAASLQSDGRVGCVKSLLRHGANPLILSTRDESVMHHVRSSAVALHLLERDYWLARKGQPFDPTVARTLLCTQDERGWDPLAAILDVLAIMNCTDELVVEDRDFSILGRSEMQKLGVYVGSWTCWRSFVPDEAEQRNHNLSVVINPDLSDFQRFLVGSIYHHLEQTSIREVACVVLGYLAPADLLFGWEEWEVTTDVLLSRDGKH